MLKKLHLRFVKIKHITCGKLREQVSTCIAFRQFLLILCLFPVNQMKVICDN